MEPEYIEVRNETDTVLKVSACRSKLSGRLYIHVGGLHGVQEIVDPGDYVQIIVSQVDV